MADDLKAHATSSQDFYALLDISPAAAENEIRRAYRRAALKYHPDKITKPTQADIDKFHLLQIANDVLSDPAVRQLYDNAREARERKKRETEMMDAAKRKMKEDLEARERAGEPRGVKRAWMATTAGDDNDAEAKLEREIQRIAEDTRRRRREAEEKLMREAEEEKRMMAQEELQQREKEQDRASQYVDRSKEGGGTNVPELERAVKVRWIREGLGAELDKDRLMSLFVTFGRVENAFMLKDKRQRVGDKREKKTVATGVVVFYSIVSAHAAVLDSEKKQKAAEGDWAIIESVHWASGNDPSIRSDRQATPSDTTPAATSATAATETATKPSIPKPQPSFNFSSLKERGTPLKSGGGKPSFGSFSPANVKREEPSGDKPALTTASLQEVTLMRLKNAQREKERKALEEKLRREDEAADAAA